MIPCLSERGQDGAVEAYEELRSHRRAGSACGRHFGLVLLLREGVAAWIAHRAADPARSADSTASAHTVPAPALPEQLHVEIVRVLADIALSARKEMKP